MLEKRLGVQRQRWRHRRSSLRRKGALGSLVVKADPHYSGRVTVPVLWDKQTGTIVNNESSEIIRMFNSAFDGLTRLEGRFLSDGPARRHQCAERGRLRHASITASTNPASPPPRRPMSKMSAACSKPSICLRQALEGNPLPLRRPADRGRLAAIHHARPLRCGLCRPFQMQYPPHRGLPQPVLDICATSTRSPASPRRLTSRTSRITTIAVTRRSTPPASSLSAPTSISIARTHGSGLQRPLEAATSTSNSRAASPSSSFSRR